MGEPRKKYYAACSFGKDSLATILLALDHGEPLDAAIYVEVMFDNERNISGDDVKQIEWIDNYAAPKIERMGCPVIKLRSKVDYVSFFHTPIVRGRYKGLIHGFPYSAHCPLQKECKLKPQRDFLRGQDYVQYVGIAAEETKRLNALDGINRISLLAKYGYTEAMAMELCRKHDLVSPIYKLKNRGGCWFCPNQGVRGFYLLRKEHPELWQELVKLDRSVPHELRAGKCIRWTDYIDDVSVKCDKMEKKLYEGGQLKFDF